MNKAIQNVINEMNKKDEIIKKQDESISTLESKLIVAEAELSLYRAIYKGSATDVLEGLEKQVKQVMKGFFSDNK